MISPTQISLADYLLIAEQILDIPAEKLSRVVKTGPAESALAAP
ncbi:MAG TPA: hypothetical protein VFD37_05915 [Solirubrobacterales bacterium]|nr:hypothetical protein [Solirubrobacterales bacterium]